MANKASGVQKAERGGKIPRKERKRGTEGRKRRESTPQGTQAGYRRQKKAGKYPARNVSGV